jgi:hypothetical protein
MGSTYKIDVRCFSSGMSTRDYVRRGAIEWECDTFAQIGRGEPWRYCQRDAEFRSQAAYLECPPKAISLEEDKWWD